jgi:hypothetical protein
MNNAAYGGVAFWCDSLDVDGSFMIDAKLTKIG